jgi:hypothetical protein
MGLDEIDTPEKLYDWVEHHSASEEVYQAFVDLVLHTVQAVCDDDDANFEWNLSNGTVHRSDGSNPTAYFLNLSVDGVDEQLMYALLLNDTTGKFFEVSFIGSDVPVAQSHGLLH